MEQSESHTSELVQEKILFNQNCLLPQYQSIHFSNNSMNRLCIRIPDDANNQSDCFKYFTTFKIQIQEWSIFGYMKFASSQKGKGIVYIEYF